MSDNRILFDSVEFYSSIITLPFWISVKAETHNRFPLQLNNGESLLHLVNLSSSTGKDIENGTLNYRKYTSQETYTSDILNDKSSDTLFRVVDDSYMENYSIEEQLFKSLVGTTIRYYPAKFRSAFIKAQLPKIVLESTKGDQKNLYIIPFVIRRGGFSQGTVLKSGENNISMDYIFFIELVLIGEGKLIYSFTSELIHTSSKEEKYRIQKTSFYNKENWDYENAIGLTEKIVNSILSRVIKEKEIELELVHETLLHRKIIGNLKLGVNKTVDGGSKNVHLTKILHTNEMVQITDGVWLLVDESSRSYDLILDNMEGPEKDPLEFTVLNSSITGNLSTSIAVNLRYLEVMEKLNVAELSWKELIHIRQSLETFEQVFNVNQTNPTLFHIYNLALKKLGIDELEHEVREKFKVIDYNVQSKGQLLINRNLYILTIGLMSQGLIEILLAAFDVYFQRQFVFDIFSFILIGIGFLVFLIIIYFIFTQNKL